MSGKQLVAMPQSSQASLAHIRAGMRRHLMIGGLAFVAIVFGLGGMAASIDPSSVGQSRYTQPDA